MKSRLEIKVDENQRSRLGVPLGGIMSLIEWLSGDECHSTDEVGLIAALGQRLQRLGLPVDRLTFHPMTLHPGFFGRTIAWSPSQPVEVYDREHGAMVAFADNPVRTIMETREMLTVVAGDGARWVDIDVFSGRALSQLTIFPLCNADGPVSAVAFGTQRLQGFSLSEIEAIQRIIPALRNVCELRLLRQTELSLLDSYIGTTTAQRILAGRIRQNEIESLEAALLLCDLRGFSGLPNDLSSDRMLQTLNACFDVVVPLIARQGGEVLKYMGDAVLAFFPGYDQKAACRAALSSATTILEEVRHFAYEGIAIKAAVSLHFGEVSYGNVGSGRRRDFALIGPDVSFVRRIQTDCCQLSIPLLMSGAFKDKAQVEHPISVGLHHIQGFDREFELFTSALT